MNQHCDQPPQSTIELQTKIKQLRKIYYKGGEFPQWLSNLQFDNFVGCAIKTTVYYNSSDNKSSTLTNIIKLLREREPVNMTHQRYYNQQALKVLYGYSNGCYSKFNDSINMSCFTQTPFKPTNRENNNANSITLLINVLNVIAPAFDSIDQPDYYKFFSTSDPYHTQKIQSRFELIFDMIFYCALQKGLTSIYFTGFGLGAFNNDPNDYIIGLYNSYKKFSDNIQHIKLYYWNHSNDMFNNIIKVIPNINMKYSYVNYDSLWKYVVDISLCSDINKILFINAWDPYSIIGNGNDSDRSWDGHFGRRSCMSILALPQFNKYIQYIDLGNS